MSDDWLDCCKFLPTAGGLTDFVVSSALLGYLTPAQANVTDGKTYRYRAESGDLTQWEVGKGVYTAAGTTQSRTTILFSSTGSKVNFSAAPRVSIVSTAEDLRSFLSTSDQALNAAPANPTGTSNTGAFTMCGLGGTCTITPVVSSRIFAVFFGTLSNTVGGDGAVVFGKFGTGVAPANGAALTGTLLNSGQAAATSASASANHPFCVGGIATGLTPGTAYWFDLAQIAVTGGIASALNLGFAAFEI